MEKEIELTLFIKEVHRLEQDYEKCDNAFLKKEIKADIQLLLSVINESKRKL